eukprot:3065379-Rhodomonas_salina.2
MLVIAVDFAAHFSLAARNQPQGPTISRSMSTGLSVSVVLPGGLWCYAYMHSQRSTSHVAAYARVAQGPRGAAPFRLLRVQTAQT